MLRNPTFLKAIKGSEVGCKPRCGFQRDYVLEYGSQKMDPNKQYQERQLQRYCGVKRRISTVIKRTSDSRIRYCWGETV
jgi:hypothetical protein